MAPQLLTFREGGICRHPRFEGVIRVGKFNLDGEHLAHPLFLSLNIPWRKLSL
jgi:hypothetical protein